MTLCMIAAFACPSNPSHKKWVIQCLSASSADVTKALTPNLVNAGSTHSLIPYPRAIPLAMHDPSFTVQLETSMTPQPLPDSP